MTSDKSEDDDERLTQTTNADMPVGGEDNEEPRVLAIARWNEPMSRRGLMKGMATAASALAVGSVSGESAAQRQNESTGEAHVQVDLRAFSDGIRSIHALGDAVHLAAVSNKGQLRVWHLDRPSEPLKTGQILSVRGVATGLLDDLVWMSGTTLHYRRMNNPQSDVWSRKERGVEKLMGIAADGVLFCNSDRQLIRLSLAAGDRIGSPYQLPTPSGLPEQVVVAQDATVWMVLAGHVYRWPPRALGWEQIFESEAGTIIQLDPLAERMVVERNGIVQLVKLPELVAIGTSTVIPMEEADMRPIGGYSTLKRPRSEPTYEPWLRSRAELSRDGKTATVTPLDGKGTPRQLDLGPAEARALSGLSPTRGYAWGDSNGRMGFVGGSEIGSGRAGRGNANSGGGGIPLAAPGASVSTRGTGTAASGGWAGSACTCNTVSVKAGEHGRSYSIWDNAEQRWVHRTIKSSEKLPEGAVCTCNTVALGQGDFFRSICSCNQVCTCNTMCTCEQVCTCQGHGYSSHYWFPN